MTEVSARAVTRQMTGAAAPPACPQHPPGPAHPQPSPTSADGQQQYQCSDLEKHLPLHGHSAEVSVCANMTCGCTKLVHMHAQWHCRQQTRMHLMQVL